MTALILAGIGAAAGKTALACGIAGRWQSAGKRVAYAAVGPGATEQAAFMAGILRLDGAASSGVADPVDLTLSNADVTLVELADSLSMYAGPLAERIGGQVLLIARYHQHLTATELLAQRQERMAGFVVNAAPARFTFPLRELLQEPLMSAGTPLLGLVPEERALMGFTVGELASHLGATYLCRADRQDELIENLMLGPNSADPAFSYFQAKPRTAIICRANRPDLQLTALEAPVNCMVFTGNGHVQTSVVYRAEDAGVPILAVPDDTIGTVHRLDGLVERVRFRQAAKTAVVQDLVDGRLDWARLEHALRLL